MRYFNNSMEKQANSWIGFVKKTWGKMKRTQKNVSYKDAMKKAKHEWKQIKKMRGGDSLDETLDVEPLDVEPLDVDPLDADPLDVDVQIMGGGRKNRKGSRKNRKGTHKKR